MWKFMLTKVFAMRDKLSLGAGQGDQEKPFLEHLDDLRKMIVNIIVTLLVMVLAMFFFNDTLIKVITHPIVLAGLSDKLQLINLSPMGPFMNAMNVSIVAGVVLSFPLLLYFVLQFVLPGLHRHEQKVLWPALVIGGGLFLGGAVFAYYLVAPRALEFFYQFGTDYMSNVLKDGAAAASGLDAALAELKANPEPAARTAELTITTLAKHQLLVMQPSTSGTGMMTASGLYLWDIVVYVKFICQFVLIFGLCFELPVVVMALVKLDILNYRMMQTTRSWAAIIITIVAAIITPTTDAFTLGLLAIPMYVLYEICIWLAYFMEKKDREANPEYYADLAREEAAQKNDEAAMTEWDNDDYNPWSSADSDADDDDYAPKASKLQPDPEPKPETPAEPEPEPEPKPASEKSLEEFAREDEEKNRD